MWGDAAQARDLTLESALAASGMGVIYRAWQRRSRRIVATLDFSEDFVVARLPLFIRHVDFSEVRFHKRPWMPRQYLPRLRLPVGNA
jgi:hypothetical protein